MKTSLAKRIIRSGVIGLPALPNQVFPLFTPTGEKLWVNGWDPEAVYPESGTTEEGMVFKTGCPDGAHSVWIMTEHDPENFRVAYVRVTAGSDVCVVAVRCDPGPDGGTRAHVAYTLTALGERGSEYLAENFSEERYRELMEAWEEAITRYLSRVAPTR